MMRNIAICGHGRLQVMPPHMEAVDTVELEQVPVTCCLVHTPEPSFDPQAPENRHKLLVKVHAFSCNYRDKSIILEIATQKPITTFFAIGSEYAGEVVAAGSAVTTLQVGDRVLNDGSYPPDAPDAPWGLPTNQGSKEYQIVDEAKLLKIPPEMSYAVAAAFSIGAQTTYSMVRKLAPAAGENVLVTAAKSNTALFAINALQKHNVNIYATTTSMNFADEVKQLGVKELIQIDTAQRRLPRESRLVALADQFDGFDCIIDPFHDVHIDKALQVIAVEGRYATCGWYRQDFFRRLSEEEPFEWPNWKAVMVGAIRKNAHVIYNCLGRSADLQQALDDYAAGSLNVVVDCVYSGHQIGQFFDRTFNSPERFGKVVYQYSDE